MVSENTYYILLDNKKKLSDIHTLSFKLKDLKKNRKNGKKYIFLKFFRKIEAGHVLKMFLNFGQI